MAASEPPSTECPVVTDRAPFDLTGVWLLNVRSSDNLLEHYESMGWNRADSIVLSGMHSRVVIAHTPYTFTVRRKMPKLPRGQWEDHELRLDSKYRQVQRWKIGGFISSASESASQQFVTVEASYPPETSENQEEHKVDHSSISVWHATDSEQVQQKLMSLRDGMPVLTTKLFYHRVKPREPSNVEYLEQARSLRQKQEHELMTSWLSAFYSYHNPDQLETVEQTATNFAGREQRLVQILTKKYEGEVGQEGGEFLDSDSKSLHLSSSPQQLYEIDVMPNTVIEQLRAEMKVEMGGGSGAAGRKGEGGGDGRSKLEQCDTTDSDRGGNLDSNATSLSGVQAVGTAAAAEARMCGVGQAEVEDDEHATPPLNGDVSDDDSRTPSVISSVGADDGFAGVVSSSDAPSSKVEVSSSREGDGGVAAVHLEEKSQLGQATAAEQVGGEDPAIPLSEREARAEIRRRLLADADADARVRQPGDALMYTSLSTPQTPTRKKPMKHKSARRLRAGGSHTPTTTPSESAASASAAATAVNESAIASSVAVAGSTRCSTPGPGGAAGKLQASAAFLSPDHASALAAHRTALNAPQQSSSGIDVGELMRAEAEILQQEHLRQRLKRFYAEHNPVKLAHVEDWVREWDGKEEELFAKLYEKYEVSAAERYQELPERERRARLAEDTEARAARNESQSYWVGGQVGGTRRRGIARATSTSSSGSNNRAPGQNTTGSTSHDFSGKFKLDSGKSDSLEALLQAIGFTWLQKQKWSALDTTLTVTHLPDEGQITLKTANSLFKYERTYEVDSQFHPNYMMNGEECVMKCWQKNNGNVMFETVYNRNKGRTVEEKVMLGNTLMHRITFFKGQSLTAHISLTRFFDKQPVKGGK